MLDSPSSRDDIFEMKNKALYILSTFVYPLGISAPQRTCYGRVYVLYIVYSSEYPQHNYVSMEK